MSRKRAKECREKLMSSIDRCETHPGTMLFIVTDTLAPSPTTFDRFRRFGLNSGSICGPDIDYLVSSFFFFLLQLAGRLEGHLCRPLAAVFNSPRSKQHNLHLHQHLHQHQAHLNHGSSITVVHPVPHRRANSIS